MLAACLPILYFVHNAVLHEVSFGFNSLEEKSSVATVHQMRELEADGYLDNKKPWTLAHVAMMPSVDNKIDEGNSRNILFNTGSVDVTLTYQLGASDKLNKTSLIAAGIEQVTSNSGGGSYSTQQFQLNITETGDAIFRNTREVVY